MATRTTRSKAAKDASVGVQKISTYFRPTQEKKIADRKRSLSDDAATSPPPSKIPHSTPSTPPPQSLSTPPPLSPSTPSQKSPLTLSPEQKERMDNNKLEAESKVIAKKFGADKIGTSWMKALLSEFKKPYIQKLATFIEGERSKHSVYPPPNDVFSWTLASSIHEVKVVIIGQDPYHGPGQAHGLCFSVQEGVPIPPSLRNMYQELSKDIEGFTAPRHGYLMGWAAQGVLLLNACLTVRHKEPNSHAGKGWENLTDAVIHWLNNKQTNLVFLLWGSYAQKKGSFINKKNHCVLTSAHPSPLSAHRGFMGNKHFSKTNDYLVSVGKTPIDWKSLPKTVTCPDE